MKKPTILVVDDEIPNVELLDGYLSQDYNIILAYNGKEALQKVEESHPDLILLDIMMPEMNGFEVCRILKENEKTFPIPILIVTALYEKEDRMKAVEVGADDFLNKPIDNNELIVRVRSLLRVKQYHDMLAEANEKLLHVVEEKYRSLFDNASDAIITCDLDERVSAWNHSAEILFGWKAEEAMGKPLSNLLIPKQQKQKTALIVRDIQVGKIKVGFDSVFKHKDGNCIDVNVTISPIKNVNDTVVGFSNIIRDITKRKRSEEQIKKSLKEKEVLLGEIHHRVKNNMQVISSLLRLQSAYLKDEIYLDIFKESQNRIMSMALVHEKLYRSQDFTRVDFCDYVKDLTNELFQSFGGDSSRISLNIDVESVSLGIDSAIPCGLIINELVTNSLKYAFPEGRRGKILISLHHKNEKGIELIVKDDGVGLPENMDIKNTTSLGLHLVTILVENQLQGQLNLKKGNGIEFNINFTPRK